MDKYAQLNRFHNNRQLQVYMYNFMYVYPEMIPVDDHFPDAKNFVDNYKKMSTPGSVPNHFIVYSHIRSEYYELYQNFDDTSF